MIRKEFVEAVQSKRGCAVIMAGSDSDDKPKGEKPSHIEQIAEGLESFGIPYDVRIASAHKQPEGLMQTIREYDELGGAITFVGVAGGTDALSGTASYHTLSGPVISCPPDAPNNTCLTNPPGSCNAYVARANNVGKLVAQIYAPFNPEIRQRLEKSNASKISKLEKADPEINAKYAVRQAGKGE